MTTFKSPENKIIPLENNDTKTSTYTQVHEASRKLLEPVWSEYHEQYISTGFEQEIGFETQPVPPEIQKTIHNHQLRINDNYPPPDGEMALMAKELDNYSVLAVAKKGLDDGSRPLVTYRYFWLENDPNNPNFDGIRTLLDWWEEQGQPSFEMKPIAEIKTELEARKKTNYYQALIQEKPVIQRHKADKTFLSSSNLDYKTLHELAIIQTKNQEKISWAWPVRKLEKSETFRVIKPQGEPIYFPKISKKSSSKLLIRQTLLKTEVYSTLNQKDISTLEKIIGLVKQKSNNSQHNIWQKLKNTVVDRLKQLFQNSSRCSLVISIDEPEITKDIILQQERTLQVLPVIMGLLEAKRLSNSPKIKFDETTNTLSYQEVKNTITWDGRQLQLIDHQTGQPKMMAELIRNEQNKLEGKSLNLPLNSPGLTQEDVNKFTDPQLIQMLKKTIRQYSSAS